MSTMQYNTHTVGESITTLSSPNYFYSNSLFSEDLKLKYLLQSALLNDINDSGMDHVSIYMYVCVCALTLYRI